MMLTRRNDMLLDFDVAKVVEMSKDNPVFYVQYAHVRCCSILKNAQETALTAFNIFSQDKADFANLALQEEIDLIKNLASWPKVLESSAIFFEPHRIAFYLQSLASQFHSLWNLSNQDESYRFILSEHDQKTAARLALCKAVSIIIAQGLNIMGVEPMQKM
jgi:arginyl-tRNA synthetase